MKYQYRVTHFRSCDLGGDIDHGDENMAIIESGVDRNTYRHIQQGWEPYAVCSHRGLHHEHYTVMLRKLLSQSKGGSE